MLLKRATGGLPVQVQFHSLFEPDMELLSSTLEPYSKWRRDLILNSLPVEVTLRPEFLDRAATLQHYLDTDDWPCVVDQMARDQFDEVVNKILPNFRDNVIRAVRVMTAVAMQQDGSVLDSARNTVLEAYIGAKAFATLRVLSDQWLINEPDALWRPQFHHLAKVWSNSVIYGLTYVSQNRFRWTFWTDANWHVGKYPLRVYIPQTRGGGIKDLESITQKDYWWHMLPQVLENRYLHKDDNHLDYLSNILIPQVVERAPDEAWRKLSIRGECFIETESHNSEASHHAAKLRATRIVANNIIEQLKAMAPAERGKAFFRLINFSYILNNLGESVLDLMPELRGEVDLP